MILFDVSFSPSKAKMFYNFLKKKIQVQILKFVDFNRQFDFEIWSLKFRFFFLSTGLIMFLFFYF